MAVFQCKYPEMCPLRLNCFTTTEWIVCCCCWWLGQRTSWSKVKSLMVDIVCPEMYSNKFFVALKHHLKVWKCGCISDVLSLFPEGGTGMQLVSLLLIAQNILTSFNDLSLIRMECY